MSFLKTFSPGRSTALLVAVFTAWKCFLSASLELHPDEAYYWLWSRHLAVGYFDHSPLVAWLIRATTVFSQAELWVRMGGILAGVALSYLAWRTAMALFNDEKVAAVSVITLNVIPLSFAASIIITPDIPSFFFWALAQYMLWKALRGDSPGAWYAAGGFFGLALLSKYTAILFLPCAGLYMIAADRRWLKSPHPYAAAALGLAMFLPVILWNARHEWISFVFQFGHGLGGERYSLRYFWDYLGGQALVAGPIVFLLGLWAMGAGAASKKRELLFLTIFAATVLAFFGYASLKRPAGANWPAFAYFPLSILVAYYFSTASRHKKTLLAVALSFSFFISLVGTLHARFRIVPLERWSPAAAVADATNWFSGWRALGRELLREPAARFAITRSHQHAAAIAYYTREQVIPVIDYAMTRPSQFNLWGVPSGMENAPGAYVYVEGDDPGPFKEYFRTISSTDRLVGWRGTGLVNMPIRRTNSVREQMTGRIGGYPVRTYIIVRGQGYAQKSTGKISDLYQ